MKVMLDTNILISIIIFDSDYLKELLENICDKHKLILSSYIIDELNTVIDKNNVKIDFRDTNDIPILYSAILSDVDILITGDKDFDNVNFKKPKILTVRKFLEEYK